MEIIRVESNITGNGIFNHCWEIFAKLSEAGVESKFYDSHFRMVGASKISGFIRGQHYCAYKSIKGLQAFIEKDELEIMVKNDFNILRLTVTDYIVHDHQVLYTKESIVMSEDISDKVLKQSWVSKEIFKELYL